MTHEKKMTGRHVFMIFAAFFGVMIAVNAAFVVVAIQSFPGESENKSYLQGLNYNARLAERAAQKELGWTAEISTLTKDAIEIQIRTASGAPISGLTTNAEIRRPAGGGFDQSLVFDEVRTGVYRAETDELSDGVWLIEGIAIGKSDQQFAFNARAIIE